MEPGLFPKEDARRIARVVSRLESRLPAGKTQNREPKFKGRFLDVYFQAPMEGIPARNGSMLGKAECSVITFSVNTSTDEVSASVGSETITVYNWAEVVVCDESARYGKATF